MEKFLNWLSDTGFNALSRLAPFLLILIGGLILIRIIKTIVKKMLAKSRLEKAAHSLIKSLISAVLYILLGLMAASSLGIDVTGIVALASVVTLAVSLALQNSLTNLIGGFTLLYTKPFVSGDYVEVAGQSGTVEEIGLTYTKLSTPDNKIVSIPNGSVTSAQIVNYTVQGTRRVDITVSASYDAPVQLVLETLREAGSVPTILESEPVFAAVSSYGDSAINYVLRVWSTTENYWDNYFTITENVKKLFDEKGVAMTYPHLNVHVSK